MKHSDHNFICPSGYMDNLIRRYPYGSDIALDWQHFPQPGSKQSYCSLKKKNINHILSSAITSNRITFTLHYHFFKHRFGQFVFDILMDQAMKFPPKCLRGSDDGTWLTYIFFYPCPESKDIVKETLKQII